MNDERYSRQTILPEIGPAGQARLASSSVLVVGAGGLGAPVGLYLAAMGVGRIGLIDGDRVELSNLHRQVLYATSDVGRLKVEAAAERLLGLNPTVRVDRYPFELDPTNAIDIIARYDVVADGTDSFATRYLVNDACLLAGVPNVFASVNGFEGQASVFGHAGGPCYRCVFPEPPPAGAVPSCAEGGVLGVLPGLMGTVQATEVVKVLLGLGEPLVGRMLLVDARDMRVSMVRVHRDAACPACGDQALLHDLATFADDYDSSCETPLSIPEISVSELRERQLNGSAPFVLDVRRPDEYAAANTGAELIPLDQLQARLAELEPHREEQVVVLCRSGSRSARAVEYLRGRGFDAVNLKGGIRAWAAEVDPSLHVV
jgi:adenylyltransferase/sulfurtransferase